MRGLEIPRSSDGKRPKIQGISFEVQAGEVMAFMMTSGKYIYKYIIQFSGPTYYTNITIGNVLCQIIETYT